MMAAVSLLGVKMCIITFTQDSSFFGEKNKIMNFSQPFKDPKPFC